MPIAPAPKLWAITVTALGFSLDADMCHQGRPAPPESSTCARYQTKFGDPTCGRAADWAGRLAE